MEYITKYMGYIVIGLTAFSIILLILLIILLAKQSKLKKTYKKFIQGKDGASLEEEISKRFSQIDVIVNEQNKTRKKVMAIEENLLLAYQKVGIVKYDAFKEMGGKLSFVLALLNDNNDGFLLNSMHSSREGCYTYVKEIIKGKSFVALSEEETQALEEALKTKDFMG